MTKPNDFFSDDLSDLLGESLDAPAPRQLPQDEQLARIRQSGIGHVPAAPTFKVTCQKCGGRGRFISYTGRDCGPCFKCEGRGSFERKTNPVQLAANREKAAEKRQRTAIENREFVAQQHPAELAWLERASTWAQGGFAEVVQSALQAVHKYGELSAGRLAMCQRGVAKDAERAAQKAQKAVQQQDQVAGIDVANIVTCFQRAKEAGLKRFTLRFDGVHFQVDKHDWAKIWVSASGYGSAKYGLIQGNAFRPGRDVNAGILARIAEISKDPMAAAKAYAQITSSCSVCGIELTNKESIEEGMGPVCAGRLRRPGAMFVEIAKGDF